MSHLVTTASSHEMATEHARVVMVMQGEPDRELLELTYGPEGLTAVKMTMVTLHGLSEEQHVRLAASAGALKERRLVRSVAEFGKIGRNEQCPCGSGKKFKRCCMPAA